MPQNAATTRFERIQLTFETFMKIILVFFLWPRLVTGFRLCAGYDKRGTKNKIEVSQDRYFPIKACLYRPFKVPFGKGGAGSALSLSVHLLKVCCKYDPRECLSTKPVFEHINSAGIGKDPDLVIQTILFNPEVKLLGVGRE